MEKQMEEVKNAMNNTAMASEREEKVSKVKQAHHRYDALIACMSLVAADSLSLSLSLSLTHTHTHTHTHTSVIVGNVVRPLSAPPT